MIRKKFCRKTMKRKPCWDYDGVIGAVFEENLKV
jgi:hypothetical protein